MDDRDRRDGDGTGAPERLVIARVWRARATEEGFVSYRAHFTTAVLPALERLSGFSGATVLHQRDAASGDAEVIVMTRWLSMDDVRGFAGDEPGRAVVEPAAHACLTWADDRVEHYDVALENTH